MISHVQITYILALWKQKHFQKAADTCYVTQPTLSMQIKKAEEVLGQPIFDRSFNPIKLTVFGKKTLPYLQEIQSQYEALDRFIQSMDGNWKEEVRIGIIPTIALYLVPEFYLKWQEKLKDIQLEIKELKTVDILKALEERSIDVGILAGPVNEEGLDQHILFHEEIKLFTKDTDRKEITINELHSMQPWLLAKGNCLRTQMVNFCSIHQEDKKEWRYAGGNLDLLIKMVEQQGGYTLIPEFHQLPKQLKKHVKEIEGHRPYRQVIALFKKNTSKKEAIKTIAREIQRSKSGTFSQRDVGELLPWD